LYVSGGKITKIEGMREHPINKGEICPKGESIIDYVYSPNRLKYPMRKDGDSWRFISWNEALNMIAEKLKEVKKRYGARALAVYTGQGVGHFEYKWIIQRFCDVYGTPNFFSVASLCHHPFRIGHTLVCGDILKPSRYEDSKCLVLWGFNPSSSALPTHAQRILKAVERGAKLIVIDPIRIPLVEKATLHLQPRPGSDCALALGLLNVIISKGLYDEDFVKKWTLGFSELAEHVKRYDPKTVEEITWVKAGQIEEAAEIYATNKPACVLQGNATLQQVSGVQTVRAIAIMQAMTGNLDVPGTLCFPPKLPSTFIRLPERGETPIGSSEYPLFYKVLHVNYREGQAMVSLNSLLTEKPYPIKAMIIVGGNPVLTWSNSSKVKKGLERLDFLVVMDVFMTPTAELADVVLPACTYWERTELHDYGLLNCTPYVMLRRKAIKPLWESWPDWKFWLELSRKMGYEEYFPWNSIEEVTSFLLKPSGITLKQLEENSSGFFHGSMEYKKYLKGFKTPSGKVELYSETLEKLGYDPLPTHKEPPESPVSNPELAKEYPLILTTGARILEYTHTMLRDLKRLYERVPEPLAWIHPETANKYGITHKKLVVVETKRGSIRLKAKVTADIMPNVIYIPHGWPQANVNLLTDDEARDPISGFPSLKSLLCKITPLA
jgi:anaerobic selenocysteine-containing dehydrogenase